MSSLLSVLRNSEDWQTKDQPKSYSVVCSSIRSMSTFQLDISDNTSSLAPSMDIAGGRHRLRIESLKSGSDVVIAVCLHERSGLQVPPCGRLRSFDIRLVRLLRKERNESRLKSQVVVRLPGRRTLQPIDHRLAIAEQWLSDLASVRSQPSVGSRQALEQRGPRLASLIVPSTRSALIAGSPP